MLNWPGRDRAWAVEPLQALLKKEPEYPDFGRLRSDAERSAAKEKFRTAFEDNVLLTLLRLGVPEGPAAVKQRIERETDPERKAQLCERLWFDAGEGQGEWLRPRVEQMIGELDPAKDDRARQKALYLVAAIGSEQSVPCLEKLMRPEEKHYFRSAAVRGLATVGTEPAVNRVLECLKSDDVELRAAAAQYLGEFSIMRSAKGLREALKDPEPRVRMLAAGSLGRLGGPEDIDALLEAARLPGERLDPKTGKRVLDPYNSAGRAVEQLGVIGGERAAGELLKLARADGAVAIQALFNSRDPDCRRAARELLREDAAGTMRRLVGASDLQRAYACPWTRTLPARHAVPALVEGLAAAGAAGRSGSAASLSALRMDPRAVAPLCKLLAEDQEDAVRAAAARALAGDWDCLVDPTAAQALLTARKKDRSEQVRKDAAVVLLSLGAAGGAEAAAAIAEYVKEMRAQAERPRPAPKPEPQPQPAPPEIF